MMMEQTGVQDVTNDTCNELGGDVLFFQHSSIFSFAV